MEDRESTLKAKELEKDETDQVTGGKAPSKEDAIHAIDQMIKYITGPVAWDMEYHFGRQDSPSDGTKPGDQH